MEDKKTAISLKDRKSLLLSGVSEIFSFKETEAEFSTLSGTLQVTGEGMHMEKLDLEKGEVLLTGFIISLYYPDDETKENRGFLSRFLKK